MDTIINSKLSYIKLTLTSILVTAAIQSQPDQKGVLTMSFTLTSPAFLHEERIPSQYTCEGEDISPGLEWSNVPEGTKSFTLSCLDPDAPPGTWVHWVLYDLPAGANSLDENLPKSEKLENGALQGACWGVDSFSRVGYYGPCPPPGHGDHRYFSSLRFGHRITFAAAQRHMVSSGKGFFRSCPGDGGIHGHLFQIS